MGNKESSYLTPEPRDLKALKLVQLDRAAFVASFLTKHLNPEHPTAAIRVRVSSQNPTTLLADHTVRQLAARCMQVRAAELTALGLGAAAAAIVRKYFPERDDRDDPTRTAP